MPKNNHKARKTRLRAWREQQGLTLIEAARRLNISRATLGPVELGRLQPSRSVAQKLEAGFREPVAALLRPVPASRAVPKLSERCHRPKRTAPAS
jgi:transcriptional regulator with XRE-family HTH domain